MTADTVTVTPEKLLPFIPITTPSYNWKQWVVFLTPQTCVLCLTMRGQIYSADEMPYPFPPLHPNCRYEISPLPALAAGTATHEGTDGADWWIKHYRILPPYYLPKSSYEALGWKTGKSPARFVSGKMMTKGIYQNRNGHLPSAYGRVWYEADLNYYKGLRNSQRIVWSNDGFVFVTYDHYATFIEVK